MKLTSCQIVVETCCKVVYGVTAIAAMLEADDVMRLELRNEIDVMMRAELTMSSR